MFRRLMVQQENWHILMNSFTELYECNKILLCQTVYKEIAQSGCSKLTIETLEQGVKYLQN